MKTIDNAETIKKAACLLKGEKLMKEQTEAYSWMPKDVIIIND